ncbi:MAG: multidrug effflux MFS transporter [Rikenellaceae bacterium]|nr:multidrug effflux MFS transporter [Rikenellaceae bacterium]
MNNPDRNSTAFLVVTLGCLAAFGPLVTDMYLPGLPAMTEYFGTTVPKVQTGITASMLGLALGQLLIGPISDRYGRRGPLLASMWLFLLSTVWCIFSGSISSFVAARLVQGLAGSGGIVLSRSVSADLFSGKELARFFAVIAAVQGLAPVGAPVLGGVILSFTRWQGVFWALLVVGVVILALCYRLRETLPPDRRNDSGIAGTFRLFGPVLRNRRFMLYVCLLSFSMAILFAFIASSPFIFQDYYRLSTLGYSVYFAVNAFAVTLGAILSSRFSDPAKALRTGASLVFPLGVATAVLLGLGLPIGAVCVPLFLTLFAAGLTFPSTATVAIGSEKRNAGTASAVLGSANFIFGGIVTPLVGLGDGLRSTAIAIGVCSAMTFLLMLAAGKRTA